MDYSLLLGVHVRNNREGYSSAVPTDREVCACLTAVVDVLGVLSVCALLGQCMPFSVYWLLIMGPSLSRGPSPCQRTHVCHPNTTGNRGGPHVWQRPLSLPHPLG